MPMLFFRHLALLALTCSLVACARPTIEPEADGETTDGTVEPLPVDADTPVTEGAAVGEDANVSSPGADPASESNESEVPSVTAPEEPAAGPPAAGEIAPPEMTEEVVPEEGNSGLDAITDVLGQLAVAHAAVQVDGLAGKI